MGSDFVVFRRGRVSPRGPPVAEKIGPEVGLCLCAVDQGGRLSPRDLGLCLTPGLLGAVSVATNWEAGDVYEELQECHMGSCLWCLVSLPYALISPAEQGAAQPVYCEGE